MIPYQTLHEVSRNHKSVSIRQHGGYWRKSWTDFKLLNIRYNKASNIVHIDFKIEWKWYLTKGFLYLIWRFKIYSLINSSICYLIQPHFIRISLLIPNQPKWNQIASILLSLFMDTKIKEYKCKNLHRYFICNHTV